MQSDCTDIMQSNFMLEVSTLHFNLGNFAKFPEVVLEILWAKTVREIMTTIQTEGSLLFVHKDSEDDFHLLIEMKGKLQKKLGQKCEDGFPAAEWKLGTPGGSRSVHGESVLRPTQRLVISTGRGARLSRRGRCFLESGEWEKKGRDERKTGKEGHNRDDSKGQEATVCL